MTLRELPLGKSAKVVKLTGEGAIKRRIMDMGITKGTELIVRKVAPLGDPIEITVRGYEVFAAQGRCRAYRGRAAVIHALRKVIIGRIDRSKLRRSRFRRIRKEALIR